MANESAHIESEMGELEGMANGQLSSTRATVDQSRELGEFRIVH